MPWPLPLFTLNLARQYPRQWQWKNEMAAEETD
jgi:hypothetical protein